MLGKQEAVFERLTHLAVGVQDCTVHCTSVELDARAGRDTARRALVALWVREADADPEDGDGGGGGGGGGEVQVEPRGDADVHLHPHPHSYPHSHHSHSEHRRERDPRS